MKVSTKLLCQLSIFVCLAVNGNAQHFMGLATSDYSAMNSIYLNPASIADCKEKVVVNMSGFALGFDNNLGTFSSFTTIIKSLANGTSTNVFTNSGHKNFSMMVPVFEYRGPSVIISLNDEHEQGFAFTTRLRGINQLNNFDQSIYNTVTNPNTVSNGTYNYTSKNFNWTANLWKEYGLSYGLMIMKQDQSELKAGVTVRYLGGIGYLGLKGNNIDATFTTGSDSFYAKNSDLEFASSFANPNSAIANGLNPGDLLGKFFGGGAGSGVGADLGVTYIYRIDGSGGKPGPYGTDDHKLSLSASVTDLGSIKYSGNNNFFVNVSGSGYVTGQGLTDSIKSFNSFKNYAKKQGYTADTGSTITKVHMPTALVISGDYQIYKFCYVNATYIGNLVNRQLFGNSYYSQLTITPRIDMKIVTVGIPITYSTLAGDMKMGLGFRAGGFFVGSDDMLALFSNHQYGFGVYMGAYVPIFKKKEKKDENAFKR
jgi:uncharacterized protein DUF5723